MKRLINKSIPFLFVTILISCGESNTKGEAQKNDFQRFELLGPDKTGITFSNYLVETNELNIVSYEYLYNGGGVGIGDFNNDGLEDLYFTGTMVPDKLYLNQGGLKFTDNTAASGIESIEGFKTGVSVIDINNDGFMDIYVSRTGKEDDVNRGNLLYINNGDATFSEESKQYGLHSESYSNHSYFFDYDSDGDMDVYILNHPIDFINSQDSRIEPAENGGFKRITTPKSAYDSDQLFRNNGNGTFTDVSKKAGINNYGYGLSASVGDFNNDNLPDIFVANDYIEPDILYINNGDGTFTDQLDDYFSHISQNSMGSDFSDINNDGLNDLIVVDMIAEDQKRQKSLLTTMVYDRQQTMIRLGYKSQQMRNVLQLNNGSGKFSEIGQMAGVSNTDWSWAPLIADFDNDGFKDMFISNGYRKDLTNCDFTIYKSDSLKKAKVSDVYDYLNLIPSTMAQNYMFKNKDGMTFEKVSDSWGFNRPSFSNGAAFSDLDNDGDLDIITNNVDGAAFVYQNRTNTEGANHFIQAKLTYTDKNVDGIGSKVMVKSGGDWQYLDVRASRGYFSSVENLVHFGLGSDDKVDSMIIQWPDKKVSILSDISADQELSISYDSIGAGDPEFMDGFVVANKSVEVLGSEKEDYGIMHSHTENPFEDFLREPFIPHKLSELGPDVTIGDVNGDGQDDIFFGASIGYPSELFISKNGKYEKKQTPIFEEDKQYEDGKAVFFDFDKDGDLDLYVATSGNEYTKGAGYQDRIYVNDSEGNFTRAQGLLPLVEESTFEVLAFDFDNDGDQDILAGGRVDPGKYPLSPRSYLFRNEGNRFIDVTEDIFSSLTNLGMITSLSWENIDSDDQKELIITGEWLPVLVYEFNGKKFKEEKTKGLDVNGWWNAIEVVDVDNDGDLDIIAGNLGLNSKYSASKDKPFSVYAKDFDGNGSIDPILCQYLGDKSWPVPQKNTITKNIPTLQSKLAKYEKYSESTIEDIFDNGELEDAIYMEVHSFASSVFINNGSLSFERIDMPNEAQISPIYSMTAEDFNGDGFADLFVGGNKYGAEVERGPYDASGGLIFNGSKEGMLLDATPTFIEGEIRDSQTISIGNSNYLIITRNNEESVILKL